MKRIVKTLWVLLTALICPAVVLASVSVSVSPTTAQVQPGGQVQFAAVVNGSSNSVVIWSLTGVNCSGIACGQITNTGLYLAPAIAPVPNVVTVTATSLADLSASASAAVIVGSSSDVSVSVSPATATVLVGQQQRFVAFVAGTTITGVTWHLVGAACGSSACGTLTPDGVYTAPATLPSPAQVTVAATSVADPSKSGFAVVTVALPVAVSVSPASVQVNAGTQKQFTASVVNTNNTAVTWSLSGSGCSGAACGTISSSGLYTAPSSVPSPPQVTVTATSVADSTKSSSAVVTVIPPIAVTISPSTAQVLTGSHQQFTANVANTGNTSVTWSLSGSGCSGSACGSISSSGLYTAPSTVPNPAQVIVTATSVADPAKFSTATVTVIPPVAVTIAPTTAQVVAGTHQQFTATVINTSNTAVTWSLAGSGCSGSACGSISSSGLYTAPSTVPSPAQVTVTATSVADSTKSSSAVVTVILPVAVTISPATAQVLTGAHQQFTANVANTSNTAVTWSLSGSGCSGSACGSLSSSGLYTAPSAVPSPAQVTVTATSVADSTKSSAAIVTIIAPVAVTISPLTAQVVTGAHLQFTATVANTSNTAVTWSLSGSGCSGAACGSVTSTGFYTAPAAVPSPAQVTVTATSVADPTKSSSAVATIVLPVAVTIAPATAQVVTGAHQQFTATVLNSTNNTVTWSLSGAGCSGSACGVITSAGLYTAPTVIPNPALISITATSSADPTKTGTASVTIVAPVAVTISPSAATVTTSDHQQFIATVSGSASNSVTWSVSGSGCSGASCGVITSTGFYTAPATVPTPAQVTVKVTSSADSSKYATATVTIVPPVVVKVSPASIELVTGGHQQFSATVTGTANTAVQWSLAGAGCSGSACGTITSAGLYTAPGTVPSPAEVTVTATSAASSSVSANATVTIIPPVVVKVSPLTAQVVTGGHQQFAATVTGATNTGVTWSVTGAGCSGSACGSVTSSGLYTAPDTVPSPAQVSVTAGSDADGTKSASAEVTIIPPVTATISPATAVVALDGQQQFQAKVTGSTNTAVTWSVSGSGCSGSACGSVTSSGLYTAPGTLPSPAKVTVKAVSQIDASVSASATVTLVANQNSKLQGEYVFQFTGFDSNGLYQATGNFSADGNGNITGGLEDVNTTVAPSTSVALAGTYQVSGDNRGTLTLSSAMGTQTFRMALNMAGTSGRFIEFDASGIRGSGVIEKQAPTSFTLPTFKGAYVVSLAGKDTNGDRIGALAILDFNGTGGIVGGSMDVNDGGTVSPTFGSFQGVYRIDTTGRGIITLSVPGFDGGSFRFAFYVVSASKLTLISIDQLSADNPVFSGPAELQSGAPYLTSTFSGPTVFSLSGELNGVPQVLVGRISFDGISQPLAEFDQNTGGSVTTGNVLTGAYSIEVNGPGTLNLDNSNGSTKVWDIYAISPDHAFVMDASSADVGMGELKPQLAAPPFSSAEIQGAYTLGSGEPLVSTSSLSSGVTTFNGKNAVSGTEDLNTRSGLAAGQSLAGSYSVSGTANNGKGTLLLTTPSGQTITLWVTSTTEVLGLEIDSSNPQPVLLHFEQ